VRYQGETLSLIAKWYTGDVENWRALTKVNPQIDPDRIIIGAKIRIPRKLLNTRQRMPYNFIAPTKPRRERKQSPSAFVKAETSDDAATPPPGSPPPEVKVEELELFGPK
jgi:hypothetical protein